MFWWEVFLAFLGSTGGYLVWFLFDCWWRSDWHIPDPPGRSDQDR